MVWINLSASVYTGMAVYKDNPEKQPRLERERTFEKNGMQETTLHLPLHTGTHIDYPCHAIPRGKTSSDYSLFPLEASGYVLDLSDHFIESIGPEHLQNLDLNAIDFLFFKTRKDPLTHFDFNFPYLNKEGAAFLADFPLKFVGTDHPGIERNQPAHETHITLLGKDILIIEGIILNTLTSGPLNIVLSTFGLKDSDAEPIMLLAHQTA